MSGYADDRIQYRGDRSGFPLTHGLESQRRGSAEKERGQLIEMLKCSLGNLWVEGGHTFVACFSSALSSERYREGILEDGENTVQCYTTGSSKNS